MTDDGDKRIETATTEQPLYSDVGGLGPQNGVEWQIDAPWRLEPGAVGYDAIPLVVTIADASHQPDDRTVPDDVRPFGRFCGMWVIEQWDGGAFSNPTFIAPTGFHEIEGQRQWLASGSPASGPGDFHQVRRIWEGDAVDDVINVGDWAEWNAVALYRPSPRYVPGNDVKLIAFARVSKTGTCSPPVPAVSSAMLLERLNAGRFSEDPWTRGSYFLSEPLKVHLGEESLPRFGTGWTYGDLHYHSQGTDNEGEMGVSYSGTVQAMKAMGLDWVFATEHASDSAQLASARRFRLDNLPDLLPGLVPDSVERAVEEAIIKFINDAGIMGYSADFNLLRDMNAERFAHLHGWLNGPDGVNAHVSSSGGSGRTPQIFLGGEVDAIPELSDRDAQNLGFRYGYNQYYSVIEPCFGVIPEIIEYTDFERMCIGTPSDRPMLDATPFPGRKAIRDVQGAFQPETARQHMVYLPKHGSSASAFVSSKSRQYGGGNRYLEYIVQQDLRALDKGYVFLAHPVAAESGTDPGRLGPDIVPYSDSQLEVAFKSPEVLGLQLWNENTRSETHSGDGAFPLLEKIGAGLSRQINWNFDEVNASSLFKALAQGGAMWDRVLLWGITPARLQAAGLNPDQPRKMFMAGGSDAHGDLNYRREGRFFGFAKANDTAIGKPRNLVFVGNEGRPSQEQVVASLAAGRFAVTDGPALRIAIDVNNSGVIDAGDKLMGEDFTLPGTTAPVLVEWKSTREFDRVTKVRLYVGGQAGDSAGVVWSTVGPGVDGAGCIDADFPIRDGAGRVYCPQEASYAKDLTGTLEFAVPEAQGYGGTRRFEIRPAQFPVFRTNCFPVEVSDGDTGTEWRTRCEVLDVATPTRLYVRAFAETRSGGPQEHRFAFTNPIWMRAPNLPPAAPSAALSYVSCDRSSRTNTFSLTVTPPAGTGISVNKQFESAGTWQTLSGTTFTALEGGTVRARGQACNTQGCSEWVTRQIPSSPCHEDPPATPRITIDYTGCNQGTNSFLVRVTSAGGGPVTTRENEYRIGASGTWLPLNRTLVTASSNQAVHVRARWCGPGGCSPYGSDSAGGPACGGGGGPGNPRPPN